MTASADTTLVDSSIGGGGGWGPIWGYFVYVGLSRHAGIHRQ